jgi:hypothetical protein
VQLPDAHPIRSVPKLIEAACYNRVRLALKRISNPLLVVLPRLQVEVNLDDKSWVCQRPEEGSMLMMAWTDFEVHRPSLHEPVPCTLHLYHMHSGLLMGIVPEELTLELDKLLNTLS